MRVQVRAAAAAAGQGDGLVCCSVQLGGPQQMMFDCWEPGRQRGCSAYLPTAAAARPPAHLPLPAPPRSPSAPVQLAESEQQYAEIYDEFEKAREFYSGVEAAMHKAQQVRRCSLAVPRGFAGMCCLGLRACGCRQGMLGGWLAEAVRPASGQVQRGWQIDTASPAAGSGQARARAPPDTTAPISLPPPLQPLPQDYMKEQRQWKEASAAEAQRLADLEKQLGAERAGRDAAEAKLAVLQVGWVL